jgi:hypothetical protein
MDFCRSSDNNKVVKAISLGVNVGDIVTGQRLGSKMSLPIFAKDENSVSALAQIYGKSGPIKCSEAGVPELPPFAGRNADA